MGDADLCPSRSTGRLAADSAGSIAWARCSSRTHRAIPGLPPRIRSRPNARSRRCSAQGRDRARSATVRH